VAGMNGGDAYSLATFIFTREHLGHNLGAWPTGLKL